MELNECAWFFFNLVRGTWRSMDWLYDVSQWSLESWNGGRDNDASVHWQGRNQENYKGGGGARKESAPP